MVFKVFCLCVCFCLVSFSQIDTKLLEDKHILSIPFGVHILALTKSKDFEHPALKFTGIWGADVEMLPI